MSDKDTTCAICRETFPSSMPNQRLCPICQEDLLKVKLYGFVTPRLEALSESGRSVELRCADCGTLYETDAEHVTVQRPVCPECWQAAFQARQANDATFQRAVRNFDKRSA